MEARQIVGEKEFNRARHRFEDLGELSKPRIAKGAGTVSETP
jgi:hypothetical protein